MLPLGDLAEVGKADHIALLLTLSPKDAQEIYQALFIGAEADIPSLPKPVRKIAELMQALAFAEGHSATWVHDTFNTEGRSGVRSGDVSPGRTPIGYIDGAPVYDKL